MKINAVKKIVTELSKPVYCCLNVYLTMKNGQSITVQLSNDEFMEVDEENEILQITGSDDFGTRWIDASEIASIEF